MSGYGPRYTPKRQASTTPSGPQPKRPKAEEQAVVPEEENKEVALWKLAHWKYALIRFKCDECRQREWDNRKRTVEVLDDGYTRVYDDYCQSCRDANIRITNTYWAAFKAPKDTA